MTSDYSEAMPVLFAALISLLLTVDQRRVLYADTQQHHNAQFTAKSTKTAKV